MKPSLPIKMSNKYKESNPDKPRTLDEARTRIAELNAQLGGKSPAKPAKQAPAPVARTGTVTSAHKAPAIAAQSVSHITSMSEIQSGLDAAKSPADRVALLQGHIDARKATLKGTNHCSMEAQATLRELQRLELNQAYVVRSSPELWSKINQAPVPDL